MESCQWWEKPSAAKMSSDQTGLILMWYANVFIFYTLNIQSFVLTEGTRRGFLLMYGSYNAVGTAENDLL